MMLLRKFLGSMEGAVLGGKLAAEVAAWLQEATAAPQHQELKRAGASHYPLLGNPCRKASDVAGISGATPILTRTVAKTE